MERPVIRIPYADALAYTNCGDLPTEPERDFPTAHIGFSAVYRDGN